MAIVIAFVGSEATGKTTILDEIERWLRHRVRVRRVHAGKPPPTLLTFVPHVLLPALRALFPRGRTLEVQRTAVTPALSRGRPYPLLFGIRAVMLAYERRAVLRRAYRSGPGTVVLSDRYPSRTIGAPDGPQLAWFRQAGDRRSLRGVLVWLEERLYRDVPAPALVLHLSAPLEVTLARNAARDKREPEDYVRLRHEISERFGFEGALVERIDTDRDIGSVLAEVQEVIRGLGAAASGRG